MYDIEEINFKTLLDRLREKWYYVIRTDDGDRYYWEVYAEGQMVCIATSSEEAYMKLGEFVENDLSE